MYQKLDEMSSYSPLFFGNGIIIRMNISKLNFVKTLSVTVFFSQYNYGVFSCSEEMKMLFKKKLMKLIFNFFTNKKNAWSIQKYRKKNDLLAIASRNIGNYFCGELLFIGKSPRSQELKFCIC